MLTFTSVVISVEHLLLLVLLLVLSPLSLWHSMNATTHQPPACDSTYSLTASRSTHTHTPHPDTHTNLQYDQRACFHLNRDVIKQLPRLHFSHSRTTVHIIHLVALWLCVCGCVCVLSLLWHCLWDNTAAAGFNKSCVFGNALLGAVLCEKAVKMVGKQTERERELHWDKGVADSSVIAGPQRRGTYCLIVSIYASSSRLDSEQSAPPSPLFPPIPLAPSPSFSIHYQSNTFLHITYHMTYKHQDVKRLSS